MPAVTFYFDVISPYAYLAWKRAPAVLPGIELLPIPILLGAVLEHHGQLGPAEIPSKRAFTIRDTLRRAADAKVPITWPAHHPFRSLGASRVILAVEGGERHALVDALFEASWARGENLEVDSVMREAIRAAGLDADRVIERSKSDEIKVSLRTETERAIASGVFGVPMFAVEGELFFGDDQLERIKRKLDGNDVLDHELARVIEARPMGLQRPPRSGKALRRALDTCASHEPS